MILALYGKRFQEFDYSSIKILDIGTCALFIMFRTCNRKHAHNLFHYSY